jgi:hypothetical protein
VKVIELYQRGVDDLLDRIDDILNQGINSKSKKQKNETLHEALGAIVALRYLIEIVDEGDEDAGESKK